MPSEKSSAFEALGHARPFSNPFGGNRLGEPGQPTNPAQQNCTLANALHQALTGERKFIDDLPRRSVQAFSGLGGECGRRSGHWPWNHEEAAEGVGRQGIASHVAATSSRSRWDWWRSQSQGTSSCSHWSCWFKWRFAFHSFGKWPQPPNTNFATNQLAGIRWCSHWLQAWSGDRARWHFYFLETFPFETPCNQHHGVFRRWMESPQGTFDEIQQLILWCWNPTFMELFDKMQAKLVTELLRSECGMW